MVEIAQRLNALSTRPPTPPKERNDPILETLSPNGYFARVSQQVLLDTPNESPSSSAEYFGGSSERGTKKVEFSPWPSFHKPAVLSGCSPGSEGNIRRLPPSRDCKSSKSILKETFRLSPLAQLPALTATSLPEMPQSAMLHLRSASRGSRLDAYSALLGCLSAYDDVPDTEALSNSLPDFVQFLRRDTCATVDPNGTLDTQLISQSLKLLIVFLCTPALAKALPDDFRFYVLDKSIASVKDGSMPKILITHYMQILVKQDFSAKHMTNERADRLLSALEGLINHQKGNSIISLRLKIYQRLLTQARPSFVAHAEHWIDHLVSGMLSTTKDVRALAISLGIEAGTNLGGMTSVSQACFDLFARTSSEGQTLVDFLSVRLNSMISSKEDGVHVPQIWSVIILLLRNRRHKLERWIHLKPWLVVLQKCFNSTEAHIKLLAMTAWNRLVFVVEPDTSTAPQMIKMLRQPIITQLNRKGNDKHSKQSKHIAQSSYCNLLYYALRPSATYAQLDLYWDSYIDKVLPESFTSTKRDVDRSCEILAALLHNEQPRTWDENRANVSGFIKPDELPSVDPKWARSRVSKILEIFSKLIPLATWHSNDQDGLPIVLAWRCFTKALGEAGKQEVKVSTETMSAIAHILNMIKLLWPQMYSPNFTMPSIELTTSMSKMQTIILEAINRIGPIAFNEQRLLYSVQNSCEAAETPSSRSLRHQGTLCSPTTHLLQILVNSTSDQAVVEQYTPILRNLLEVALSSTSSRGSQLRLLRDLMTSIVQEDAPQSRARIAIWCLIAEATELALDLPRSIENNSDSPQYSGHGFRDVAKILETGLHHFSGSMITSWQKLFAHACNVIREEIGDGGINLTLTEPLSDAVQHQLATSYNEPVLVCATGIVQSATWPKSSQTLDRARKLLWGISAAGHKPGPFDPFDKLYTMIEQGFVKAYEEYLPQRATNIANFLRVVENLLLSVPPSSKGTLLRRIHRGVASWIEDQKGILAEFSSVAALENLYGEVECPELEKCSTETLQVRDLWFVCRGIIETLPHTQATLAQYEALIIPSLTSRHQSILNDSIELWNGTFGIADALEYSPALRNALSRLSKVTELQLPNFPYEDDTEVMSSSFNFIESQDSQGDRAQERPRTPSRMSGVGPRSQERINPTISKSTPCRQTAGSGSKSLLRNVAGRVSKTPSKARLRHDNSQIQFAVIDSSPLALKDTGSPFLTDHQKEIRERQHHDAAMFPKLGSSPPSGVRETEPELPRLVLNASSQRHGEAEHDDQSSPVLPVLDENLEVFLGSSPTPRSSSKSSSCPPSDAGPPSSPQGISSLATIFPKPSAAAVRDDDLQPRKNSSLEAETLRQSLNLEGHPKPEVVDDCNVVAGVSTPTGELSSGHQHPKVLGQEKVKGVDTYVFSDFDIFVDAPTEPVRTHNPAQGDERHQSHAEYMVSNSPAPPVGTNVNASDPVEHPLQDPAHAALTDPAKESEDSTSQVLDSFLSQASQASQDEEQIDAQLAADMERVSSQAERPRTHLPAPGSGKKRKCQDPISNASIKKPRRSSRTHDCYVVVETGRPDINKDEYTLDARSASNSPDPSSRFLDLERAGSPSNIHQITPTAQKVYETVRGSSQATVVGKLPSQSTTRKATRNQAIVIQVPGSKEKDTEDQVMQAVVQDASAAVILKPTDQTQPPSSQPDDVPTPSPRKSAYRRLMDGFRNLLGEVRQVTLRAEEERAVTGVLFESILEVHEAGKRHSRS